MEKKTFWAPFLIDKVKDTFGIRGSSHSESNHHSVKPFVIRNVDGIHGAMQELMKRQKTLMLKNNHGIAQQYMELQLILFIYVSIVLGSGENILLRSE